MGFNRIQVPKTRVALDIAIATLECSLIYVSRKVIAADDEASVAQIVAAARLRNAELNVTGVLISAGHYFAQILEGPTEAVEALMASIVRDPRHNEVTTLRTTPIVGRVFPDWAMGYSGPSTYLARNISPLLGSLPAKQKSRVDRLIMLMTVLGTDTPPEG